MTLDLYPGSAEADFGHNPPMKYPEPATPEEVRVKLGPTDSEHSADAL